MYPNFVYTLRRYGVPANTAQLIELTEGIRQGQAQALSSLFTLARLVFIKRVEHLGPFEKAFVDHFLGIPTPPGYTLNESIYHSKPFQDWLAATGDEVKNKNHTIEERINGFLSNVLGTDKPSINDPQNDDNAQQPPATTRTVVDYSKATIDELAKMLEATMKAQESAHGGGGTWVGSKGYSPFGHSGTSEHGIRVGGNGQNGTARRILGDEHFHNYSDDAQLSAENIRQALEALKHMEYEGPRTELDVERTVNEAGRKGFVELFFIPKKIDKMSVALLIDNGGSSMDKHIPLIQLLFSKMRAQLKDLTTYFFHNCIYNDIFIDAQRTKYVRLIDFLRKEPDTRLIIVGDAAMAPEEVEHYSLRMLRERFRYSIWLNPRERSRWHDDSNHTIRKIFPMEDITLGGIKKMVSYLAGEKK